MGADDEGKESQPQQPTDIERLWGKEATPLLEDDFTEPLVGGMFVATEEATYGTEKDQRPPEQGITFIGFRRHDQLRVAIDFEKLEDSAKSRLRQESFACEVILAVEPLLTAFLHTSIDFGVHEPWLFTLTPGFSEGLPEMLVSLREKDELDRGTILKSSCHMFLAIEGLHRAKIIHGNIRPENFVIGSYHNNRKIMLMDFACAVGTDFPSPQPPSDMVYASRGRQRDFESTRKDDLESWIYCVMEMYNKVLVPWLDNKSEKEKEKEKEKTSSKDAAKDAPSISLTDMLKLKRAFCSGKMWKAMAHIVPDEFKEIMELIRKIKNVHSPDYSAVWHQLMTACARHEIDPFAPFTWNKGNTGNLVLYSKLQNTAVPLDFVDID